MPKQFLFIAPIFYSTVGFRCVCKSKPVHAFEGAL